MDHIKNIIRKFYVDHFDFWSKKIEMALTPFKSGTVKKDQNLFAPIVFIVAVLWAILTVGIAIGSLVTLFASLLVLYFILTKIFGVDLNLKDVVVV